MIFEWRSKLAAMQTLNDADEPRPPPTGSVARAMQDNGLQAFVLKKQM